VADEANFQQLVADVAAAYFQNSHVTASEISNVIGQIASSLAAVGAPAVEAPAETVEERKLTPAQIRKSITRDALISFEDGKSYKTLRRHLAVKGLTPEQYREKWGLAKDYPMVSPAYSEARSNMAKALGLGRQVGGRSAEKPPARAAAAAKAAKPKTARKSPGRPAKAKAEASPASSTEIA
jgi:predicted transcriptional regulator